MLPWGIVGEQESTDFGIDEIVIPVKASQSQNLNVSYLHGEPVCQPEELACYEPVCVGSVQQTSCLVCLQ